MTLKIKPQFYLARACLGSLPDLRSLQYWYKKDN
jgi:hypothetical protein